jgi:signal transduction histidine kinase
VRREPKHDAQAMAGIHSTSIASKLTRMNMLVTALALVLACAGFTAYDFWTFRSNAVRNLSTQAQAAAAVAMGPLVARDTPGVTRVLASTRMSRNVLASSIYDANGQLLASYLRDRNQQTPARPTIPTGRDEAYRIEGSHIVLVHSIAADGKRVGYILYEQDMERIIERIKTYSEISALLLLLSLAFALIVSRIARRAIANPVARLAATAKRVSVEQNYSLRAEKDGQEGELAILVESFNEMLDQIEARDRRLQAARDQLEDRVQERTEQLTASNKELESFCYSVSHDLRAPLRSIDGFSLALEEDYGEKLDAQGKNYIQRVRAATQRMGLLIDDLLNLSRVTRAEMQKERVDLTGMAKTVANELGRSDGDRKVEWLIEEGLEAHGDARLLRIVMDNLLGNAWKYTSKHRQARIEFRRERHNGSDAFLVKDDGAGFDPAYSQRLFGAFQRLHGVTEFSGTGVGLATVQRIIRRHGGDVWAEGEIEKGATFHFTV